jgi:hypothetical protein
MLGDRNLIAISAWVTSSPPMTGRFLLLSSCVGVAVAACSSAQESERVSSAAAPLSQAFGTSADTFINSAHTNNNNGASTTFFTGQSGQGGVMRGLLRFDLPAGLQERVTVTSATLTLTMAGLGSSGTTSGTAATETLRVVTQSWAEGNGAGTAMTEYTVGDACGGAVSGATWNQSNCPSTNWSTAGGTVAGSTSATGNTTAIPVGSPFVLASSTNAGMLSDVQAWIDMPSSNFGWRISSSTEATSGQAQRFYSKEAGGSLGPSLSVSYACKSGFADTGSGCTTCTSAALAACVSSQSGNSCNDPGAPSATYSCNCSNAAYASAPGNTACVDKNECAPNPCVSGGDSTASCTDQVAPATGYSCTCSAGFGFNGTTCVLACGNGADPCGAGGTCSASTSSWTCDCTAGWVTSGGALPTCVQLDACTPAGNTACVVSAGNTCVDEAPPSVDYHCGCSNSAYVAGIGNDGKPACVAANACTTNHCRDSGDAAASCAVHAASAGYDCSCSVGYVSSGGATPVCVVQSGGGNPGSGDDAGGSASDGGTDAGNDSGAATNDSGPPTSGGTGGSTGGTGSSSNTGVDAGRASSNAGNGSSKPSGTPKVDAGTPSSSNEDAGAGSGKRGAGGCGCRVARGTKSGSSSTILLLVGLCLIARRLRSRSETTRSSRSDRETL